MDTKVLTAHVPLPLARKIDDLAARLDRPRAWIVKQALAAWVGEEEERHRLTMEGMADVTAGRVVDQADVEAWAASLATCSPLPVPQQEEVGRGGGNHPAIAISHQAFVALVGLGLRTRQHLFEAIAVLESGQFRLLGQGRPAQMQAQSP